MTGTFTIRANVPPPTRSRTHTRGMIYPFWRMAVGESFTFDGNIPRAILRVRKAASAYGQRHEQVYRVAQGHDGLWACWRLA